MSTVTTNIETLSHEERVFPPAASFSEKAHVKSLAELEELRREAQERPDE
jgi:acetyl-CoA synthetase